MSIKTVKEEEIRNCRREDEDNGRSRFFSADRVNPLPSLTPSRLSHSQSHSDIMADGNGISRYMSDSLRVSKALQAFLIARQQCETQYATALAEACYTLKGACESKIDLADGKAQASPLKQAVNELVKGTGKIADARYAFAGTMKKNILEQFDKTLAELQSNFDAQLDEMEHMQDPLFETYDHYKKLKTAHDMNKQQVQEAKDAVTKAQQEAPQKKKELEKLTQRVTTLTQKMIQSNQAVCEAQTGHDDARQRYLKVLPQFQKAISEWDEMRLNSIKQMFIEIKHLEQVALEKAIEANNVGHDNAVTIDVAKIVSKFEDSLLMKDIEVRKTSATSIRDLKSPTKAGTLYLKRNDSPLSPWSVQYMVLKYNRLYIFDNAEADQPREVITLNRLLPDGTSLNASKSSRNRPKSYSDRVTSDFAIIHIAHQSLFQKASCFQLLFHSNCVVTSFPLEFVDTDTMEVSENSSFFYAEEDEKSTKDLRPSIGKRSMMETSTERAMDRRYYFMPVEKDPSVSELWLTAFEQNGAQTCWCGSCIPGASSLTLKLSIIDGVNLGVDRGSNDNFGVMVKFGNLKMGRTAFKQGRNPSWNEEFSFDHVTSCTNSIRLSVNSGLNLDNGDSELGFLFFSLKEMDLERRVEATMRLTSANQSIYEKSTTLPTLRVTYLLTTNSKLPVGAYNTLVAELTTPPLDTFHFLSGSLPHDQRDEFYDGYLTMMLALNDPILPAIASLIDREIAGTDDPNILFRGNSVLTKILERFMRILGSDYVKDTIGESINSTFRICSSNGNSFEIDPNRIPETEEKNPEEVLAENWQKLLQQVDLIWSAISVSYGKCPLALKVIFSRMKASLKNKYAEEKFQHIGISGFIFLRLFCVAILAPKRFSIVSVDPDVQTLRTLTLITKIMQHLANFSHFGAKERHMERSNEWINSNTNIMKAFINEISSLPPDSVLPRFRNSDPDPLTSVSNMYRFLSSQTPGLSLPSNLSNPVCKSLLTVIDALDSQHEAQSRELLEREKSRNSHGTTERARPVSSPIQPKIGNVATPPLPPTGRRNSDISQNTVRSLQTAKPVGEAEKPNSHSISQKHATEKSNAPTGGLPNASAIFQHTTSFRKLNSSFIISDDVSQKQTSSISAENITKLQTTVLTSEPILGASNSRKGSILGVNPALSELRDSSSTPSDGTQSPASILKNSDRQPGLSGFMSRFKNPEVQIQSKSGSTSSTDSTNMLEEKQFNLMSLIGGAKNYISTSNPRSPKRDLIDDDISNLGRKAIIGRHKELDDEKKETQSSKTDIRKMGKVKFGNFQMRTDNDERRLKQIQAQLSAPDNCMCADCLVEKSKYAVTNIGAFICARCAELHKRMGPEFSVLKKIKDEKFTDIEVSFMSQQGNRKVNALYCANGPHGPPPPSDVEARIQMITHGGKPVPTDQDVFNFIIDKYKRLKFMKESDRKKIEASRKANAASGKKPTSREIKAKPLEPVIIEPDDHLTFEGPLKLLASMGFTDTSKCIMALKRSKGSVDGAVGLLVNSKESDWKLQTPVGVSSGTAPSKNDDTAHLSKVLEAALEFLEGMGFKNRDQNLDALRKAEGDIEKAVSTLTSSSSATQGFGKTTGASAKQETETSFDMDLLSLVDNGSNCSNESSTPFGGFFGVQVSSQLSTNQGQQDFYLRQMEAQRIQQTQLQAQLWKNQQKVLEQHPQQSIGQAPSIQQPQMNIFFQGQPSVVPQPSNASVFSTVFQPESNDPFAALVQGSKMPQQFATFQQSQTGDSSGGFQNNASPYLAQQAYQQVQHFGYTVGQHRQQVPAYSAVLARQPQQQGAVYSAYSLGQQQQQIPIGVSDGQQVPRSMMGQYSQPAMENQFSNGQTMYQSQEKENSQFQQQQNRQPAYGFRQ